jgi:inner membrane protein YidH
MSEPEPKSANELAQARTDLATDRTLMAADRSLMAWIRTALSMDSFGFTIYKLLTEFQRQGSVLPHADTPRNLGIFLTGLGTLSMIVGAISYMLTIRDLRKLKPIPAGRPTILLALLMSAFGLFLFFGILRNVL